VLGPVPLIVAGSLLGGFPFIRDNVDLIAVLIVALSLIPVGLQILTSLRERRREQDATE